MFAGFGRGNTACGAGQKTDTQPCFQPADGVAQGRLGQAKFRGCPGEAPFAGHGHEGQQVIQILARHS